MDAGKDAFLNIREAAHQNEDILGFAVTGSRGKGFETPWSGYDCVRPSCIKSLLQRPTSFYRGD